MPAQPKVILTALARADLRDAIKFYDRQQHGLGERLADAVALTIDAILARPESFRVVRGDVTRAQTKTFPYGVYFRPNRVIRVLAIIHLRRHPRVWQRRGVT